MAQHETEHGPHGGNAGAHGEHAGIHLPDPSIWPLVVGIAFALVGGALIWWQRDTTNDIALVAMGAAGAFALLSACGWAYEDGRMRAKAETGRVHEERSPRFNQLVTFAIADGSLAAAQVPGGLLDDIEGASSALRDLDGFQDLRMTISPADAGPSQVIVETTWSGREQLAGYDETRQTMLDILARYENVVVPGSVQVFDMQVLRDTKDTAFRFGAGAATTVLGSLVLGGFAIGAGLTMFENDEAAGTGGDGNGTPPAENPYEIVATDNAFSKSTLQAPPNTEVTFTLVNEGATPHNLSFYESQGGDVIHEGQRANGGETVEETFTTPGEGTYFFQCDFHPTQMTGTFEVTASAPQPGGGGGDGGGAGGNTITADNLEFDTDELTATAGQEFSVTLQNEDSAPHNISFYESQNGELLVPQAEGEIIQGGESTTVTFTPPEAGTFYFQCDVHPTMNGDFAVS